MKPLSDTLTELGIAFTFPIKIEDKNGCVTYREYSEGLWHKYENDANGKRTYYESSDGVKMGTPRSAKTCEGKVVEVDGIKYKLSTTENTMKSIPIKVSVKSAALDWNPVFNSVQVGVDDEASGSFLIIYGDNERDDSAKISLDWEEWDELVKVVRKYRNEWEWK